MQDFQVDRPSKNRSQLGCGRFGSYQKSTENLLNTQQI
nr:MAG TPA: hypothetical protein [Bacteriophage sp.]